MATLVDSSSGVISASGKIAVLAPVQDLAALAARTLVDVSDGSGVMVIDQQDYYIWLSTSTITPDGVNVILPASYNPENATMGRWIREIEKAMPSGVATLDASSNVEQPTLKVWSNGEVLAWGSLTDNALVKRSGLNLVSTSLVQTITASSTEVPSAAAVKTFVEAQDAAQNEIHEITGNTMYVSGDNVGIGTASPSRPLNIQTTENEVVRLDNTQSGGDCALNFRTSFGTDVNWAAGIKGSDDSFRVANSSNVGASDRLVILADGKIGIGTLAPAVDLDVAGAGAFSGNVTAASPSLSAHLATKAYVDAQAGGTGTLTVVSATASASVDIATDIVHADPGGSTITITLPTATAAGSGKFFRIKNVGSTGTVVIATAGGSIDGVSSKSINSLVSLSFVSDGTDYWIH